MSNETLNERFKSLANENVEDAKVIEETSNNNVDFMDSDFSQNISSQKAFTTEAHAQTTSDKQTYEQAKENPVDSSKPLGAEDFDLISMFVIEFADAGMSNGLRWISKEKNSKQFEIDGSKKLKLRKMLSLILEKRQAKMSIELMFVCTLLLFYLVPVKEAIRLRKINSAREEAESEKETQRESKYKSTIRKAEEETKQETKQEAKQEVKKETFKEEVKEAVVVHIPPKRKPGRPRKGEETYKQVVNGEFNEDSEFNLTDEEIKGGITRNED